MQQRLAKGLSQEQLAEQAELHWTYISGIERGQRSPTLNTLGSSPSLRPPGQPSGQWADR